MKTTYNIRPSKGFALIATLSIMILLMTISLAMLSLSNVTQRSSKNVKAMAEAQANARMALMIAIGELQIEMGPDMRISAEAAIHDSDPSTEAIDDIAQPHWLAAYSSWGNYLNAEYDHDRDEDTDPLTIQDTYVDKRAPMFRRWLLSLPENLKNNVDAPVTALDPDESVIMVGSGTLGEAYAKAKPLNVTRAHKIKVGDSHSYAWWIGPENHKAKVNLAAQQRNLTPDQWTTAQGVSSEVAVGAIDGLEVMDTSNSNAADMARRIITLKTLGVDPVNVGEEEAKKHFFDLTDSSVGVLSNTRTGGLKKDLSLLFENNDIDIAANYKQSSRLNPEPSIRPHSEDVLAQNADLPRRPFASWPNMRQYYRMYRTDEDSSFPSSGASAGTQRNLVYSGGVPQSSFLAPWNMRDDDKDTRWFGENAYLRMPIITRYLLIHSYRTERFTENSSSGNEEIAFLSYNTPVVTFWNPYNVPLVIDNGSLGVAVTSRFVWPHRFRFLNDEKKPTERSVVDRVGDLLIPTKLASSNGSNIVFQPGEIITFSFPSGEFHDGVRSATCKMYNGFDPSGIGGVSSGNFGTFRWRSIGEPKADGSAPANNSYLFVETDHALTSNYGGNYSDGNTPGSLNILNRDSANTDWKDGGSPAHYQIDGFQKSQLGTRISQDELGEPTPLVETVDPLPIAYSMLTLKTTSQIGIPTDWAKDWRSRNWLHAPPYYFGSALYMTEESQAKAHTQRLDSPYEVSFGPTSMSEIAKLTGEVNGKPMLGFGPNPNEKVTSVPALELPTTPISSLASFSGMRINPGWIYATDLNSEWHVRKSIERNNTISNGVSLYNGQAKTYMYQSGITGGGIGNSFIHPMIPREAIYQKYDNSVSHEQNKINLNPYLAEDTKALDTTPIYTKAYSDYWDHALVLNDSLWDEYFISSIADQTRAWASDVNNLETNIDTLTSYESLPISRYKYHDANMETDDVKDKLRQQDAYLRVAEHLMVDGAFNVNSTSVNAWYALFKGIRERKLFYRDSSGALEEVSVPDDHIAVSRFDTPTTDKEISDVSSGVLREDGNMAWSGVRFLDDDHLKLLAEKCVEQVKLRGPFLNFSEFINRRLEDNDLGLMGALQSAIDYDDASPNSASINYLFKSPSSMMSETDLGVHEFQTPEAVNGSRFAGIPGYVMQSDILKPISNTLQVRDDTFRIRAYGESLDADGNIIARAWCEAVVQRIPEYLDSTNNPNEGSYVYKGKPVDSSYDPMWDGKFTPNTALTVTNSRFGRKFEIKSFRWLSFNEI